MDRVLRLFQGNALRARAMRGSVLTVINFGGQNALRLGSNLILTRILFPEAFGLMALVQVFIVGLQMFSDFGIQASVIRSDRGKEPAFLDTAYTAQVIRGVILWLGASALAIPAAAFYEEPQLAYLLPVVGFTAVINGFMSINMMTANRDLVLGRLTVLELTGIAVGIVFMVIFALIYESVWALVVGSLIGALVRMVLSHRIMPGHRARLRIERSALGELFSFGKWIFLSTLAGFLIQHGDRAILGKYITLAELSLYTIAFFLATVPEKLNEALNSKILYPIYCSQTEGQRLQNQARVLKARALLVGGGFALSLPLVIWGDELVTFLYDPRYHGAGPILVGICLSRLFRISMSGYGSLVLAVGDSRGFAGLMICSALLRTGAILIGAIHFGIPGVVIGAFLGHLFMSYPITVYMAMKHKGWDWRLDAGFAALTVLMIAIAVWGNGEAWQAFLAMAPEAFGSGPSGGAAD